MKEEKITETEILSIERHLAVWNSNSKQDYTTKEYNPSNFSNWENRDDSLLPEIVAFNVCWKNYLIVAFFCKAFIINLHILEFHL